MCCSDQPERENVPSSAPNSGEERQQPRGSVNVALQSCLGTAAHGEPDSVAAALLLIAVPQGRRNNAVTLLDTRARCRG